ncbi:HAMP domain-containing sensor histidine kinase [Streptomyces massasporeus]|uniref:sensor histidine kinase n=1 Tax=Streptomyces massasporeus TaxID=67324 RepID=UPI003453CBCD
MSTAPRRVRLTIRARITLTYGALFAASGAAMVLLLYVFMSYGPDYSEALTKSVAVTPTPAESGASPSPPPSQPGDNASAAKPSLSPSPPGGGGSAAPPGLSPSQPDGDAVTPSLPGDTSGSPTAGATPSSPDAGLAAPARGLWDMEVSTKDDFLQALFVFGIVVFVILLLISVIVGWFVAGRMLAPLQQITATARVVADSTLHERIALAGPRDEIRELADTFNAMLRRLEQAFEAQRRFAANASHELRTPLASMRTILQVALASPDPEEVRAAGPQLLTLNKRSTEITEALLTLARADHGAITHEPVDLAQTAREHCVQVRPQAHAAGVRLTPPTGAAPTTGDRTLLRQLVANLIDNAVKHNHQDGSVTVSVHRPEDGRVRLTVRNTGQELDQEAVDRAIEPFHRLDTRTEGGSGRPAGHGLGLAIVRSIVRAHDGTLRATPLRPGGLEVAVELPGIPPAGSSGERRGTAQEK